MIRATVILLLACCTDTAPQTHSPQYISGDVNIAGDHAGDIRIVGDHITGDTHIAGDTHINGDHRAGDSHVGGDAGTPCSTDADCTVGEQWCVGGFCVPCDNTAVLCDIDCGSWSLYVRNGCTPCACAPVNECTNDVQCAGDDICYAGAFCWDWCPDNDPSCCYGNICSPPGCSTPPTGCMTRGCPQGQICELNGCNPSLCVCDGDAGSWLCTADCGGGMCN